MLTKLRIKNFKAFEDTGYLDIRPLTLLMGPNGSGKSSILQLLLLIRQTVDSRDVKTPLVIEGPYVHLGSYRDFVHRHETKRNLEFELVISEPGEQRVSVEFKYNQKTMLLMPESVRYSDNRGTEVFKRRSQPSRYSIAIRSHDGLEINGESTSDAKFYDARFSTKRGSAQKRFQSKQYYEMEFATYEFAAVFENTFSRLFYLGPLREAPQRFYLATSETPQDVGLRGETTMEVLWAASRNKPLRERILSSVKLWLKNFAIASDVTLKGIGANVFTLRISDFRSDVIVNLADVGFGASQVLPIIVEGFYSPPRSTLIIEQPEIHLHPRAQGQLADLLIDIVQQGQRNLIVETHSEHLIARLQRRIAEGSLIKEDIALYYCNPTASGTKVQRIYFNALGQFVDEGLPEGFFEEGYRESIAHYEAMAERN